MTMCARVGPLSWLVPVAARPAPWLFDVLSSMTQSMHVTVDE
jgi:hypothetical protein